MIASIPSPSSGGFHVGPLQVRAYGLMIAVGVVAAVELARYRWKQRGGDPDAIYTIALWAVPAGVIGARIYHVITDNELYRGRWLDAFKIWNGGLGIWGGVAAGVLVGALVARRKGYDIPTLLDCVAPALPVAQAIGRIGNYFNQELFGGPTTLPWGLEIDPAHRPVGYEHTSTFQPTFLYEALWNLALAALIIWVIPRLLPRLKSGRLFVVYIAGYTLGRLFVELMRVDPANLILGQRVNVWVSVIVLASAVGYLIWDYPRGSEAGQVDEALPREGSSSDVGSESPSEVW